MIRKPVTIQLDNGLEARPIEMCIRDREYFGTG